MNLRYLRRIAAELLGCGVNRIWITNDPAFESELLEAITRDDVRRLVARRRVQKRPEVGVSRGRARVRRVRRAQGRRRGPGTRKGTLNARDRRKRRWIRVIRPIRRRLRELREAGAIDAPTYRKFYAQAKGGMFKNRAHLEQQLRTAGFATGGPQ